jgi:rhodanese-related sulfurtransferase
MRRRRQSLVLAGVFMLAAGFTAAGQKPVEQPDSSSVPRMSQEEFKRLYATGGILVVDVRNEIAFEAGRIPGAVHVALASIDRRAAQVLKLAKGRTIVTYCSCVGEHTSAEAGLILIRHGARDVRALVGGFIEWARAGGKIER